MQISKIKLKQKTEKEIQSIFQQTLADMRKPEEIKIFLQDFFTPVERKVLCKRLAIALYLKKGKSYLQIKEDLKVSSATIAKVEKMITKGKEGFALALRHIEAEEWAAKISEKIISWFKKI